MRPCTSGIFSRDCLTECLNERRDGKLLSDLRFALSHCGSLRGEMLAFRWGIRIAREAKFGRSVAGTAACLVGVALAVPLVGAAAEALRA